MSSNINKNELELNIPITNIKKNKFAIWGLP